MFLADLRDVLGRCLGSLLGHVCKVVGGMLRGFQIVLGKVVRGYKINKKPITNLYKHLTA